VDELIEALQAIARAEGRYSRDPLTHASNTIDDMVALANTALANHQRTHYACKGCDRSGPLDYVTRTYKALL